MGSPALGRVLFVTSTLSMELSHLTLRTRLSGVRCQVVLGQFHIGLRVSEELGRFSLLSTKYPFLFIKECEEHLYTGADSIGTIVTCVQTVSTMTTCDKSFKTQLTYAKGLYWVHDPLVL